eukprot:TRINITY_DN31816_c0_g2_i1.p1 TRINITY_DN31816_c0_g2~~TRINITY_DN31816_c0_g2_i1.p1  ORF type:complete len:248 (+),score=17.51 TRINITY_DN31816_c0_g2_i1:62-745(+)
MAVDSDLDRSTTLTRSLSAPSRGRSSSGRSSSGATSSQDAKAAGKPSRTPSSCEEFLIRSRALSVSQGPPWQAQPALPRGAGGFPNLLLGGAGWKPKTLAPETRVRRDPITGKVDVFRRSSGGEVEKCKTLGADYRQALQDEQQGVRPRSQGRQKGLAEVRDLQAIGAPHWNPAHKAALHADRRAFHKRRNDLRSQTPRQYAAAPAGGGARSTSRPGSAPAGGRRRV